MTTRTEPQAVREIHEIRERLHEERKHWTRSQRRAYYDRIAEQATKRGLRVVPHDSHRHDAKHG